MSTTFTASHDRRTIPALSAVLAAGVLLLGACSSDDNSTAGTSPAPPSPSSPSSGTATVTAEPPQGTPDSGTRPSPGDSGGGTGGADNPGEDACSAGLTGDQAAERWIGEVPPSPVDRPWTTVDANSTYDPCAALSWIVLPVEGGTGSSPYQIMLFHSGEYLGTATSEAYGFFPDIVRTADDAVDVTWSWTQGDDSTANPSGRSTAQFRWDDAAGRVVMTGEVPPV